MMQMRSFLCAALLLSLVGSAWGAEIVYITDELWVMLRATPTDDADIIHGGLRSGTELELLEHDVAAGYTHVRMSDGSIGWIASQYLVAQPIASDRLDQAERKLADLTRANAGLVAENAGLAANVDALGHENIELQRGTQELAARADEAERAIEAVTSVPARMATLGRGTQDVEEMNTLLRREVDDLVQENHALAVAAEQRWMLTGVGLLVLGVALGAFVARRKRGW